MEVRPDIRGFGDSLKAQIAAEAKAAGGNVTVPVRFDVDSASAAKARAALGPLAGLTVPIKFDVDQASAAKARTALGPLAGQTVPVKVDVDTASIARANAEIRAALATAAAGADSATTQWDKLTEAEKNAADTAVSAFSRIVTMERDFSASMIDTIAAVNATTGAEERLFAVSSEGAATIDAMTAKLHEQAVAAAETATNWARVANVGHDFSAAMTGIIAKASATSGAEQRVFAVSQAGTATMVGLTDATRGNAAAAVQQALATKKSSDAMSAAIPLWTSGGGRFGFLTGQVQLFGGALTKIGVPAIFATASGLHILIDATLELGSTLLPAAIAFGAFYAAAIPTINDIKTQMTNLNTVTHAFGVNIYPLSGGFQQVADAVRPEVYQLFGEALVAINSKTGEFSQLATGAGRVLDQLGARFVAALTNGNGFGVFLKNAVTDLAKWGDIIGNIGGIFGNIFKALPGYASFALTLVDGITKVAEAATGAIAPILKLGLAAHGILLWSGLAVTALVALRGPVVALGTWFAGLGSQILGLLIPFEAVAAQEGIFAATTAALSAVNPFVWVAVAVGAIAGLTAVLLTSKDAAQQFNAAIQQTIQNAPLLSLQSTIQSAMAQTATKMASSSQQVNAALKDQGPAIEGAASRFQSSYNPAVDRAATLNTQYGQGLSALRSEQDLVNGRVAALSKTYGGNTAAMALMNAAGITSAQITNKNDAAWAAAQVQIKATADAFQAMAVGVGRAGAANNALGSSFMTETLPAIQKVTSAEDTLINTVIGGQQSFTSFQQAMQQMALDAGVSTGYLKINEYTLRITGQTALIGAKSMGGLNAASLKLAGDFYSSVVPAAQKVIDALQQQGVSTKNLTTAVATEAGQMLTLAGNNTAARATVVALINNALGPGTVSMQNLNTWTAKNSTTLQGFKAIVDQATVSAGTLANVLQNDLNAMFAQDLLDASGASKAMKIWSQDVANNTATTAQGKGDRAQLIKDLENAGYSAQAAGKLVDGLRTSVGNLSTAITNLPASKDVLIKVNGQGVYSVTQGGLPAANFPGGTRLVGAAGGIVPGYAPGQDTALAHVSPGEAILVPELVRAIGPGNILAANKKYANGRKSTGLMFAGGGVVGSYAGSVGGEGPWTTSEYNATTTAIEAATAAALAPALNAAAGGGGGGGGGAGFGGGAASGPAQALARQLLGSYGWGPSQWGPLQALWTRESGWSAYAVNPSSGAYGIPQALPAAWGHPYALGDYAAQIRWGLNYIAGRYGSPAGAWSHEQSAGWYDQGGWLPKGLSLAYNGTGQQEMILSPSQLATVAGSGGGGTEYHAHFDGWTQGMVISQVQQAFTAMSVNDGRRLRIGRRS